MSAAKTTLTEAAILSAIDPGDHSGTPTYLIRNRIDMHRATQPSVAEVRKILNRMEGLGKVHRTKWTRPNSVVWQVGRHPSLRPQPSPQRSEPT